MEDRALNGLLKGVSLGSKAPQSYETRLGSASEQPEPPVAPCTLYVYLIGGAHLNLKKNFCPGGHGSRSPGPQRPLLKALGMSSSRSGALTDVTRASRIAFRTTRCHSVLSVS